MADEEEEPPFVVRLFGRNWESLEQHPDCWNRWFGEDSDDELAKEREAQELREREEKRAKNLLDHSWIKQRLDEEVGRFITRDLKRVEDRELTWRRSKLFMVACVVALLAQFPYILPIDSFLLKSLSWSLIIVFFTLYFYSQILTLTIPWNTILELKISSPDSNDSLFIETNSPRYSLSYEVTVRSVVHRDVKDFRVIDAAELFTPSAELTPEPLHKVLVEQIAQVKEMLSNIP
jgi:hypothetical protein